MGGLYMLDYGAGNVRSLWNAVRKLGYEIQTVKEPADILKAEKLIFPGVGAFGHAMLALESEGYTEPLKQYIASGKPYFGICVGMQTLFEGSDETPDVKGLGIIPGRVRKFDAQTKAVPHMGWNSAAIRKDYRGQDLSEAEATCGISDENRYYFVHSYAVPYEENLEDWVFTTTKYGDEVFVSSVRRGNMFCTQFHPEKSGYSGLRLLKSFLESEKIISEDNVRISTVAHPSVGGFTKRIIACLDVRANDAGDLVVTKGDQYDVREKSTANGDVRNLGKPVDLARRYFEEGADEITFLNITSFRNCPMTDLPMLEVLRRASQDIFVPLTIGGGIRDITDPDGTFHSALHVANEYFRSGADKVSIGSDAVYAAEKYIANGNTSSGTTAIETIAKAYGAQAVVISVDPKRVYVQSPSDTHHHVIKTPYIGPNGEQYCWYQCTVKGGREARDLDVRQLVVACEAMGAGEILLNCMDKDGTNSGYDLELIQDVKDAVSIPVVASSGAGSEQHFIDVFAKTNVEAALAAGIFHRQEVPIANVKKVLKQSGVPCRPMEIPL
ncbi:Imidazole glycerol phosphate synthase hisHF [Bifiguratus adelaidae]|uniref:Imidazole glycerol phosphate synthase hisHF n=1 Tax=Bifiguratus adelaidae TaxID=1938954 RepID=A0A261Y5S2_9FUNG|nr:Imidazole glycerol phosphate synthase hisHF [Bifiguratus adelaidae]